MIPTTPSKKLKKIRKASPPALEWQTGSYDRHIEWESTLPYGFLLIAKLMDERPYHIVHDFINNLAFGSMERKGRDKAREILVDYFIEHGYGQKHYTSDEIRTMFKELDAIGMLWPDDASSSMRDLHAKWRDEYYNYWFNKWYQKLRRKPSDV